MLSGPCTNEVNKDLYSSKFVDFLKCVLFSVKCNSPPSKLEILAPGQTRSQVNCRRFGVGQARAYIWLRLGLGAVCGMCAWPGVRVKRVTPLRFFFHCGLNKYACRYTRATTEHVHHSSACVCVCVFICNQLSDSVIY